VAPQKKNNRQNGSSVKKFYWILGAIGVLGVVLIGLSMFRTRGAATDQPEDLPPGAFASQQELVAAARGISNGPDNAPVKLLVFSDYMCPACKQFALNVEPGIRDQYIKNGQVQLVYYDFPLGGAHKYSFLASRAGRCALDQNKFWEYHDLLFERQSAWSFERDAPVPQFIEYARELGLNAQEFESCVRSEKHSDVVTANRALGLNLGVNATPTIYMNGRMVGDAWSSFDKMKPLIDRELGIGG